MIYNFLHAVRLMNDACLNFVKYLVSGIQLNREQIDSYVENSLMLVTALTPKIGYDKAAKIAYTAHEQHCSLKEACLKLGFLTENEFDTIVRPEVMLHP